MTIGSLFTGIGGFDLGFEQAGLGQVKWQVEIDRACRRVLERHWPHLHREEDITRCGTDQLEKVDIICAGFPCQDLSIAGKRAGLEGARSGLFYEMTRIVYELEPAFVVWENVPGLLNSDDGRDMLRVLREFHRIGYHGAWRRFDAQYFGVAQRRRRCFGVFARGDIGAGRCAEILSLAEGMRRHPTPSREAGKGFAADVVPCREASGRGTERTGESRGQDPVIACTVTSKWTKGCGGPAGDEVQNLVVAHTLRAEGSDAGEDGTGRGVPIVSFQPRIGRNGRGYAEDVIPALNGADAGATSDMRPCVSDGLSVRRLTPAECERLQGFPDGWTAGESDSARYRMLGNAVAVPVARWIGERMK